jgi:hypothetical protein
MRKVQALMSAAVVSCFLPGCAFDKHAVEDRPTAELGVVLKRLRQDLDENLVGPGDSKTGLGISKLTVVLKIATVKSADGKVSITAAQPVGTLSAGASMQGTIENTITIEFAPDGRAKPLTPVAAPDTPDVRPPKPNCKTGKAGDIRYLDKCPELG